MKLKEILKIVKNRQEVDKHMILWQYLDCLPDAHREAINIVDRLREKAGG